jgi:hypothetical protein
MTINDIIEVPPVQTVVRLEEGRNSPKEITASFVLTAEVRTHITVIAEALAESRGQGYFLQGDFGSGKSHFLAALYAWLSGTADAEGLSVSFCASKRVLPAAVSLVDYRAETPLETVLLEAIERAAAEAGKEISPGPKKEDRKETFERVFTELDAAGFSGLVLLVDELSEFMRSKPNAGALNEDARTLQFLGEFTQNNPLWIIAAVQESIESTGDIARAIIRKIKDRYPVKLTLSTLHIRDLISRRLVRKKPGADDAVLAVYEEYRNQFPGFDCSFDEFRQLYPVHPATIGLLDGLGDLFSQHRGIVDFVCSRIGGDRRRNIPSILDRPVRELLGPDSIFDHFATRLAEFSAYNIYPRHIVPHLDREIDKHIANGEDRHIAKRIVRMLVLYRIHPTADIPNAGKLAELAACGLDAPDLNARFITEALLDPLASVSRFLHKRQPVEVNPALRVYEISVEEDSGKVLEARIERLQNEISDDDSRLVSEALLGLPESDSWPGPALAREGLIKEVEWNLSRRRGFVRFLHPEERVPADLSSRMTAGSCDFALLLTLKETEGESGAETEAAAIWRVSLPEGREARETLKEFLAVRLLRDELNPSSPADAPLIPQAAEKEERLKAAASQAALEALYAGEFTRPRIRVDAAVRQLKRFDGVLEAAAKEVLPLRYPRFREIAPRNYTPTPRMYQLLLENFVIPGTLPLRQARHYATAIDGLADPLGLVEMKRGSYVFSPDISGHPLLVFFFELLRPSGAVPFSDILDKLEHGDFGLPKDTALFLVASLAAGGVITIRRGGRAVPLEYLNLNKLEQVDEVALGELIGERDRATLLGECGFLSFAEDLVSFGLRQQRDAWKEVASFKRKAEQLIAGVRAGLSQRTEYASFQGFPFTELEEKLKALEGAAGEIRVSYSAKEGLEKFLAAWRNAGLTAEDIQMLKGLERFLQRGAEKFIFMHHYLRHEAVEKAAGQQRQIAEIRLRMFELMEDPLRGVLPDEGAELEHLFSAFRERYVPLYTELHRDYYEALRPPPLSKNAGRALEVLKRLSGIESLDRPPGLDRFLRDILPSAPARCGRQVREELMRSPVCGCGFFPGQAPAETRRENPEQEIDRYLSEYIGILRAPTVLEALGRYGYALRDLKPETAAELDEFAKVLRSGNMRPSSLVTAVSADLAGELAEAVNGTVTLRKLELRPLVTRLAGRRLPVDKIHELVSEWLGPGGKGELIALEGLSGMEGPGGTKESPGKTMSPEEVGWWARWRAALFPSLAEEVPNGARTPADLEAELERRFPGEKLTRTFRRLQTAQLIDFIRFEPFHTGAVEEAYRVLAEGVLTGDVESAALPFSEKLPPAGHADPEKGARIGERLLLLGGVRSVLDRSFPERLRLRPLLERLLDDPWSGPGLREKAAVLLSETADLGEEWLLTLPPVRPVNLDGRALVIVVDGVPPDVWLGCMDRVEAFPGGLSTEWARLDAEALTVPATAELLGLEGDPLEALEAADVPYLIPRGREEDDLLRLLDTRADMNGPDKTVVARLGTLDREAHSGGYKISDMTARLRRLLETKLEGLLDYCRADNRELILTTDHGMSVDNGALRHGAGGVYERAVFRAVWKPAEG